MSPVRGGCRFYQVIAGGKEMAGFWKEGSKTFFLAVPIGVVLLCVFTFLFPEVSPTEVLGVVVLVSLGLAVAISHLYKRLRGKGGRQ